MIVPRRRKRDTFLPWVQLAVDCASIYLLLHAVFWVRFASGFFESNLAEQDYAVYHKSFGLITLILVFFLRVYGLYKPRQLGFAEETMRALKAVTASVLVLMAFTFFIREFSFSRTFFVLAGLAVAAGLSAARYILGVVVVWADSVRGSQRNILVLGATEESEKLVRFYQTHPRFSARVMGFLDDGRKGEAAGLPVFGPLESLPEFVRQHREVHEVVLAIPGMPSDKVLKIIYECEKELVAFRWVADMFGLIASKMSVSSQGGVSVLSFTDSPLANWENRALKRAMDVLFSLVALGTLSPLMLLVAIGVKLGSKGPVFYAQQRIGEDGRRFPLYKFRTMQADAEEKTGPVWAKENDPRRTPLGAFLRQNNLDELPQLWNVLKGDMSLVGPRPERPVFVSQFKEDIPRYMARHTIKSGITGWAQVNGLRGNTSIEDRTQYDLFYIENWSLLFDLKILLMTLFARRNAY